MSTTPRTDALLARIYDRDGQVGSVLGNAPEEWVVLCRELELELARAEAALVTARNERDAARAELSAYRSGGVTEEILRRHDGFIKIGLGCEIAIAGTTAELARVRTIATTMPPAAADHTRQWRGEYPPVH